MGATISVTNSTDADINVSIQHFGPIKWKNGLKPGATVEFQLEAVWYTVEIVESSRDGSKEYTTWEGIWKNVAGYGLFLGLAPVAIGFDIALACGVGTASAVGLLVAGHHATNGANQLVNAAVISTQAAIGVAGSGYICLIPRKVSKQGVYAASRPSFEVLLVDDKFVLSSKKKAE